VASAAISGLSSESTQVTANGAAYALLAAKMRDANNVQRAMIETTNIANKVYGDTSHTLDNHKKALSDVADAYDRALASSQKHVAQFTAEDQAIGLGVGAMEQYRTSAALWTAAMQAGRDVTPELTAQINAQAAAAGAAAQKLAEDKAAAKAAFDLQSVGLSGVEKSIADLNYQLHGDHWKEFGDSGVAQMTRFAGSLPTVPQNDNERPAPAPDEEKREAA
jgi:hypothetical protein